MYTLTVTFPGPYGGTVVERRAMPALRDFADYMEFETRAPWSSDSDAFLWLAETLAEHGAVEVRDTYVYRLTRNYA